MNMIQQEKYQPCATIIYNRRFYNKFLKKKRSSIPYKNGIYPFLNRQTC